MTMISLYRYREGGRDKRELERGERYIYRERVKGRGIERQSERKKIEEEKISTSISRKISQTAIW